MLRNVRLLVWERANGERLEKYGAIPGTAGGEGADLEKFPWPFPDWPLERVLGVYHYVAGQLADSDGRVLDEWDELTAGLARIILEERAQADYADHWQHLQELKSKAPGGGAGGVQIISNTRR